MKRALPILFVVGALLPMACSSRGRETAEPSLPTGQPTVLRTVEPQSVEVTPELPGQSDTAWGPIWDEVPDSFPVPVDAAVADPSSGPVSGAWTVPVADVKPLALARYYRDALEDYGTSWATGVDGPLEDGSYTVWSSNGYGCETLTTILPRGDESLVTVLFGVGCRFN